MKNQRFLSINLDFLGFSASILCAIHCAAVPLLLTLGSFSSMAFLKNPFVEGTVLLIGCCLAFLSLLPGYFRKHRNLRPLLLMLTGSGLIISGHLGSSFLPESAFVSIGAFAIAVAHYKNWHLNKKAANNRPQQNHSR